jgi:hypothetical protein
VKQAISIITALSLGLAGTALGDNYNTLAAKGYRWIAVHGPYGSTTEQGLQHITGHRNDRKGSQSVEDNQAFYLIPGRIVYIMKEDPAAGTSLVQMGGFPTLLWTYTRFLSKRPVRDVYGVIETPENSGLIQNPNTAIAPDLNDQSPASAREPNFD